jgi:hypothetical protein
MQVTRVQPTTQGACASLPCTNSRVFTGAGGVIFHFPQHTQPLSPHRPLPPISTRGRRTKSWQDVAAGE